MIQTITKIKPATTIVFIFKFNNERIFLLKSFFDCEKLQYNTGVIIKFLFSGTITLLFVLISKNC